MIGGGPRRSPHRRLAAGVTLLSVTVAAVVAAAAAATGAALCSAPVAGTDLPTPPDVVCYQLVRTLAERVGVAAGLVTAMMALTVVGLSRLVTGGEDLHRFTAGPGR